MKIVNLCIRCKGRGWCGKYCPIYAQLESRFKLGEFGEKDFSGSSPAPFVGHYGYPYLNVGILCTQNTSEDAYLYDAPRQWSEKNYQIPELVVLRSSLINSRFKTHIKGSDRFLDIAQEVGMASKPADLEVNLKKKPRFKLDLQPFITPMGPRVDLIKASLTSNPRIHFKVDKVVSDKDLKANEAILYLYKNKFDENFLTRLISVGQLGLKKNRRLVPTRWSITCVDDIIAKSLINEIKNYGEADYQCYFGSYLGNYYLILFFPDVWSYELFEMYLPKASWNPTSKLQYTTDYESYYGRKTYAEECSGGYYACRVAILEKLSSLRKQGSVLALRFITDEYNVPLGVFVCREATRKSLNSKSIKFSSLNLVLNYAKEFIKNRFNCNIEHVLKESKLLNSIKTQKKLTSFI